MEASSCTARVLSNLTLPVERWVKPVLIGIFGVPGAGKTEVARYLSHRHPLLILSTDALRLQYGFESGLVTRQVMDHLASNCYRSESASSLTASIWVGRIGARSCS